MITYKKASSTEELNQILELQKSNLPQGLSKEELKEEGFLTVKHSLEIIQKMNDKCPHTIAKFNDEVIGYALSMTKSFASEIEILKPLFLEISKIISNENYIVMGQICVGKEFRKQGVFRGLYKFMKEKVARDYDLIITEIDAQNMRSLSAHKFVGFRKIKTYFSNNQEWVIVALKG